MDQIKIGKYIAQKRKEKGLTQAELANTFNISDRAVSKWENGISLPDSSIMIELSKTLGISVNELLLGEDIMENDDKKIDELLVEFKKREEERNKMMLRQEIVMMLIVVAFLFITIGIATFYIKDENTIAKITIIGVIALIVFAFGALKIEQTAGYYVCKHCGHKHVPSYSAVAFAMHIGFTRFMKCPKCGKWSWQKKTTKVD